VSVTQVTDDLAGLTGYDEARGTETVVVQTTIADLADKAFDAYDVYLRLHLLSHRLVAPHGLSADGFFGLLTNVVWTKLRPVRVGVSSWCGTVARPRTGDRLRHRQVPADGRLRGARRVGRIADADRVRLGAHPGVGNHGDARGLS